MKNTLLKYYVKKLKKLSFIQLIQILRLRIISEEGKLLAVKNNINSNLDSFSEEQLKFLNNTIVNIKKILDIDYSKIDE